MPELAQLPKNDEVLTYWEKQQHLATEQAHLDAEAARELDPTSLAPFDSDTFETTPPASSSTGPTRHHRSTASTRDATPYRRPTSPPDSRRWHASRQHGVGEREREPEPLEPYEQAPRVVPVVLPKSNADAALASETRRQVEQEEVVLDITAEGLERAGSCDAPEPDPQADDCGKVEWHASPPPSSMPANSIDVPSATSPLTTRVDDFVKKKFDATEPSTRLCETDGALEALEAVLKTARNGGTVFTEDAQGKFQQAQAKRFDKSNPERKGDGACSTNLVWGALGLAGAALAMAPIALVVFLLTFPVAVAHLAAPPNFTKDRNESEEEHNRLLDLAASPNLLPYPQPPNHTFAVLEKATSVLSPKTLARSLTTDSSPFSRPAGDRTRADDEDQRSHFRRTLAMIIHFPASIYVLMQSCNRSWLFEEAAPRWKDATGVFRWEVADGLDETTQADREHWWTTRVFDAAYTTPYSVPSVLILDFCGTERNVLLLFGPHPCSIDPHRRSERALNGAIDSLERLTIAVRHLTTKKPDKDEVILEYLDAAVLEMGRSFLREAFEPRFKSDHGANLFYLDSKVTALQAFFKLRHYETESNRAIPFDRMAPGLVSQLVRLLPYSPVDHPHGCFVETGIKSLIGDFVLILQAYSLRRLAITEDVVEHSPLSLDQLELDGVVKTVDACAFRRALQSGFVHERLLATGLSDAACRGPGRFVQAYAREKAMRRIRVEALELGFMANMMRGIRGAKPWASHFGSRHLNPADRKRTSSSTSSAPSSSARSRSTAATSVAATTHSAPSTSSPSLPSSSVTTKVYIGVFASRKPDQHKEYHVNLRPDVSEDLNGLMFNLHCEYECDKAEIKMCLWAWIDELDFLVESVGLYWARWLVRGWTVAFTAVGREASVLEQRYRDGGDVAREGESRSKKEWCFAMSAKYEKALRSMAPLGQDDEPRILFAESEDA